jgi:KaiC/GvpD/RAD55 family RecA-like ATPase
MDLKPAELRTLGVFTPETLETQAKEEPPWTVEGLFQAQTVNLLVGDSGIGKTPLMVQLGVAVASGTPFLGRRTRRGSVLYADFESPAKRFLETVNGVTRHLGLEKAPDDFLVWSPEWQKPATDVYRTELLHRVKRLNPALVIVDPLRLFDPDAPVKNEEAAKLFKQIRREEITSTWVLMHHRKKTNHLNNDPFNPAATLEENPKDWLQNLSGALAMVNHTDTRLGVMPPSNKAFGADLVLNGFVRGHGELSPAFLARVLDDDGDPLGYRLTGGLDMFPPPERVAFKSLPDHFKYSDVKTALNTTSDSKANKFVKKLIAAGMIRKKGDKEGYNKTITEDVPTPMGVRPAA